MHFGLVAFDLFAAMYREEIDRAGESGWPQTPSVADAADIPAAIVEHNLFGIDIDLRAVQLSALTLLLKARSLNPKTQLSDHNLACADVLLLNGLRLATFIAESHLSPIYERLVRALWARLKDANQLGSLLRLETDLEDLIAGERRKFDAERDRPHLPGFPSDQFDTEAGRQEFWGIIQGQIVQSFDAFARHHATEGQDEHYFAGEATKGLRLLDVMLKRYDVVVANPPYMSNRNMSVTMNDYLKQHYPDAKNDLYAAFIDRCVGRLVPDGRLGMITQQSFMFISRYEELRQRLGSEAAVEVLIHVGPRAFAEIGGEKVNTTLFALRREPNTPCRSDAIGTYFRLVKEPNAEAKKQGFERALAHLRTGQKDSIVYRYRQGNFDAIPGAPWVYWITPSLRQLFKTLPKMGDVAKPAVGQNTGDNFRFLRFWWEVRGNSIAFGCPDVIAACATGKAWFPYMKGGAFQQWYGNQEYCVNWKNDGEEVKAYAVQRNNGKHWSRYLQNLRYLFQKGITWTDLTSGRFSARLSPGGFIFDVSGSSAFPSDIPLMLAVMNSTFAQFALKMVNPTMHVQVGDLARLPIPIGSDDGLHDLVQQAIDNARANSEEHETTFDFVMPPVWGQGITAAIRRATTVARIERKIDECVSRLYAITNEDRVVIEDELRTPVVDDTDDNEEYPTPVSLVEDSGEDAQTISGPSRLDLAARWISYTVGIVLGRFAPGVEGALGRGQFAPEVSNSLRALTDGSSSVIGEESRSDTLSAKVRHALEIMCGEDDAQRIIDTATGGKPLVDYLKGDFYKAHVQQYRKRPVYWLLQSPRRNYSVYIFHERMTEDTLHLLRGAEYLGGAINAARNQQVDLGASLPKTAPGAARKRIEKELAAANALLADLMDFDANLAAVTGATNTRGEAVGWQPEPDDGVLLNLAPLRALMPSWPNATAKSSELRKAWEALANGDYDWSHTARRYWPDRVAEACRHNKSFAIAHGLPASEESPV